MTPNRPSFIQFPKAANDNNREQEETQGPSEVLNIAKVREIKRVLEEVREHNTLSRTEIVDVQNDAREVTSGLTPRNAIQLLNQSTEAKWRAQPFFFMALLNIIESVTESAAEDE